MIARVLDVHSLVSNEMVQIGVKSGRVSIQPLISIPSIRIDGGVEHVS